MHIALPNKACGLPSTEDALNLVNSRKKHGAGELITKTLHAAFFFHQKLWDNSSGNLKSSQSFLGD